MADLATPKNSAALMASRKLGPDSLDFFPTHPWAARALCEYALPLALQMSGVGHVSSLKEQRCLEPACGAGDLVRGLEGYFADIETSDIHDWPATLREEGVLDCREHGAADCPPGCRWAKKQGWSHIPASVKAAAPRRFVGDFRPGRVADFVSPSARFDEVDWVITNPPFNAWMDFATAALETARVGVALFLRLQWMETDERYYFCHNYPPALLATFAQRVPLAERRLQPDQATATAYCWVVWLRDPKELQNPDVTPWLRIGPVRDRLIRPGDYDAWSRSPAQSPLLTAGSGS